MTIRKAQIDDAGDIKALVLSLSHFFLENEQTQLPIWFSKTLDIAEFEWRLSSDEFCNIVATENNNLIGYISMKDDGHVIHLFVAEAHQGRGLSKVLWNAATASVDSRTYTVRSSIYAVPVYKSLGFKASEAAASKDGIRFQPMVLVR